MVNIIVRKSLSVITCILLTISPITATVSNTTQSSPDEPRDLANTRVIGGSLAPINKYRWFAEPKTENNDWAGCGGSLVTPEYVLTAAHCFDDPKVVTAKYRIGAFCNQAGNCGQASQIVNVARKYVHEGYNSVTANNDFALMKLASRVTITNPVKMDQGTISPNYPSVYRNLMAPGFGRTNPNLNTSPSDPNKLMEVELAYVPQATCNANHGGGILPSMMCAADPGQGSCKGDSGGPLYDANVQTLVGVVSWGSPTMCASKPTVYARIANQWTWIKNKICADHSSPKPDFCGASSPVAAPSTSSGTVNLGVTLVTDNYPEETKMEIYDVTNSNAAVKVYPYGSFSSKNTRHSWQIPLSRTRCYHIYVFDKDGDGLCCKYGSGWYSLSWNGNTIKSSSFQGGTPYQEGSYELTKLNC